MSGTPASADREHAPGERKQMATAFDPTELKPTTRTGARKRSDEPEFGPDVCEGEPCRPRELFSTLFLDPEDHVHCLEPVYRLVSSLLRSAALPPTRTSSPDAVLDDLMTW